MLKAHPIGRRAQKLSPLVKLQQQALLTPPELPALFQQIVNTIVEITAATGASIEIIAGDTLVYSAVSGSLAGAKGARVLNASASNQCIAQAAILIVCNEARVEGPAQKEAGGASLVVVPLIEQGKVFGVLKAAGIVAHRFADSDIQMLELLAGFVNIAFERHERLEENAILQKELENAKTAMEYMHAVFIDGESKQLNEVQEKQQATLRSLIDAIPGLVAFVDPQKCYRYCNRQFERMFGFDPDSLIGRSLPDVFAEIYENFRENIERALTGEFVTAEDSLMTVHGIRHLESTYIPQFDSAGEPDGFYFIALDITERKTQEISWQSRALTDQHTGTLNREFFISSLDAALQRSRESGIPLAVLYLDIDHFKKINDTYGHAAGDFVLERFAHCLLDCVRHSDFVGRMGGDEFCILISDVRCVDDAILIANKILNATRPPVEFKQHTLTITTSIGITYAEQLTLTPAQLLEHADAALYQAKQGGRNRIAIDLITA